MRDGHHKEAAEVAKANREPKATPFSSADAWSLLVLCAFRAHHFVVALASHVLLRNRWRRGRHLPTKRLQHLLRPN